MAILLDPSDMDLCAYRGSSYDRQGQKALAQKDWQKYHELEVQRKAKLSK